MTVAAIGEHGVIGNMRSAALVSAFGEIDFFCFPDFDSPSVFASLLDGGRAGCFSLGPEANEQKGRQFYLPDTNVLLTRFLSEAAVIEVCDFMPVSGTRSHCIVRQVTVVRGEANIELCCRPAFDYARTGHRIEPCSHGVVLAPSQGDLSAMRLLGTVPLQSDEGGAATAHFLLRAGECASFVLGLVVEDDIGGDIASYVESELRETCDYWRKWAARSQYKGRWREMVTRSALALKLLTSNKHGAILAAATFGLPETAGGSRNWDYRYVWMRDASFAVYAFTRLGYVDEGQQFERWLKDRINLDGERGPFQPMYRLDGSETPEETRLEHFAGYLDSSPVLIGNSASTQLQLDIYGAMLDAVYLTSKYGDGIPYEAWFRMKKALRWLELHWRDPDEGIWEVRGGRKEFLHSRLMCWVAFDRAIRLGERRSLAGPFDWLRKCRDDVMNDIHKNFWNTELGAFVQYKGANQVDASTLLMPLLRFISVNDPRWLSTLKVIEQKLVTDTMVMRYSAEDGVDGLTGAEGSFLACAFWLVEAKARSHQVEEARVLFEKLLNYANPVGLYGEEMNATGEHLGNFPQALSHLALISAATYLDRCLGGAPDTPWR